MKWLCFSIPFLLCVSVRAQIIFTTNSLPSQPGDYSYSYFSTDVNVSAMLALNTNADTNAPPPPGGPTSNGVPQFWKFSQAQQSEETVQRTDIISASAGEDGSDFPMATYAEQDSTNGTPFAWQYYGFSNSGSNPGRLYYGLYEPVNAPASASAVFVPPSVDIPGTVQYGQTWTRSLHWNTTYYGFITVSNYFTCNASVDAFGTLALPDIGLVSALRVHEVHSYTSTELVYGGAYLVGIITNQFYYWLAPGLGVAVQVTLFGNNEVTDESPPFTNSVLRMYQASYFTNSTTGPAVPGNLRIQRQSGSAVLIWDNFTNVTSYQVQYTGSFPVTNWQTLGTAVGNSWTDTMTLPDRFYRVIGNP